MPKSLTHHFVQAIADGADATLVRPSNWNADHDFWLGYRTVSTTSDTIAHADHLSLITYTNAGATAVSIPAPTIGPPATMPLGWIVTLRNSGGGTVTLTGTGGATFNGGQPSIGLNPGDALELHSTGAADYAGIKTSAPAAAPPLTRLGGYLSRVSATALQFVPFNGSYIMLNGVLRSIPVAGIAGLGNTGVYVNGVAGQNLAINTTYWIFVFDVGGVLTADFRTAATHVPSTSPGNEGTEILTGNDTRSFIGMCYLQTVANFFDSPQQRLVRSWFNRKTAALFSWFTGDRSTTSATFVEVNNEIEIFFLTFSDETVDVSVTGTGYPAAVSTQITRLAIGIDSVTVPENGQTVNQAWNTTQAYGNYKTRSVRDNFSEGLHYATVLAMCSSGGTFTIAGGTVGTTIVARVGR